MLREYKLHRGTRKLCKKYRSRTSRFFFINLSRSLTSTSTPKDVQINTKLQSKQKSTIKPDKQLKSNLFGNQQNTEDDINVSESDDRELRFGNPLPPSVNQNVRRKYPTQNNYNINNTYISSLYDKREQQKQYCGQQVYNYMELKDEITETVTNHTNKLIDDEIPTNERKNGKTTIGSTRNGIRKTR